MDAGLFRDQNELEKTQQMDYYTGVPIVLRVNGFVVRIFLPPREHGPAHVHVSKQGGSLIVILGSPSEGASIRNIHGMRTSDVLAAMRIIEDHIEELREQWRKYHE